MTEQEAINFLRSKGYKVDKVTQPAHGNTSVSNQTEQQYGNNMTADGIVKGMNTANTMLNETGNKQAEVQTTEPVAAPAVQGTKDNPWPNSIKAQAEAKAGDYITTSKGLVQLTQGDINWAKQKVSGTPVAKQVVDNEASLRAKVKEARDAYNKAEKSGSKVSYEEKQRLYNIYLDAWKAWKVARG